MKVLFFFGGREIAADSLVAACETPARFSYGNPLTFWNMLTLCKFSTVALQVLCYCFCRTPDACREYIPQE